MGCSHSDETQASDKDLDRISREHSSHTDRCMSHRCIYREAQPLEADAGPRIRLVMDGPVHREVEGYGTQTVEEFLGQMAAELGYHRGDGELLELQIRGEIVSGLHKTLQEAGLKESSVFTILGGEKARIRASDGQVLAAQIVCRTVRDG